jgi:hypothetical protein
MLFQRFLSQPIARGGQSMVALTPCMILTIICLRRANEAQMAIFYQFAANFLNLRQKARYLSTRAHSILHFADSRAHDAYRFCSTIRLLEEQSQTVLRVHASDQGRRLLGGQIAHDQIKIIGGHSRVGLPASVTGRSQMKHIITQSFHPMNKHCSRIGKIFNQENPQLRGSAFDYRNMHRSHGQRLTWIIHEGRHGRACRGEIRR